VHSPRVANQEPVVALAMPVSVLRFEPGVDLQARNFAEGQADIAIRGGTFANTGITVGGLPLYDPQTAHYTTEVPLPPGALSAPRVAVGSDLAGEGIWNAAAGGVAYDWAPIRAGGEVALSGGEWNTWRAEGIYGSRLNESWSAEVSAGHSSSDGPFADADHDLMRTAVRLQRATGQGFSNFVAAYQDKFFGWPNLYTPFNSPETEDIQTLLLAATHRQVIDARVGTYWQVGAYHRRNDDNYAYNRYAPVGPVPPFKHTTRVSAVGGSGRVAMGEDTTITVRSWVLYDELESTSLRFGEFYDRTHFSGSIALAHAFEPDAGETLRLNLGLGYDDTDRGAVAVNPQAGLAWERPGAPWSRLALAYSAASQAPSYTAVAGNPNGGLFRGNPRLDRATSRTLDLRGDFEIAGWTGSAALFRRWDDELVDWTFRQGVFARSAQAVDLTTDGVELLATRSWVAADLVLGYTWLHKDADYGTQVVDGSFYALNFPRHRITAAVVWRLSDQFTLRLDNEVRWQQPNPLRTAGGDEAWLSVLGVYWQVPTVENLQLSLQVDNVWDSDFQEIPAVPAAPRMVTLGARWRW